MITTPATDRTLLTIDELRFLAGVSNGARDLELRNLETRIAASIMSECNIAIGSGAEPTLRRETLTETIYAPMDGEFLILSRRHSVSVSSLTLDGSIISASGYVVDPEKGVLLRLEGTYPCYWSGQIAVVLYDAGFATVPGDLKQAAMDYFRGSLAEAGRDPFVKSETKDVPGVGSRTREFWVGNIPGQSSDGPVPAIVAEQLKRFRNRLVA